MRIPGNTTAISDDWAAHRARGSLGGTDFMDAAGTVMRAMASGVVTIVDNSPSGSGGRYVRVRRDDGTNDTYDELHALSITISRGARVAEGAALGVSGGSGFGKDFYYGAHIHVHGNHPNGQRFDLEPLIFSTTTAGRPNKGDEELSAAEVEDIKNAIRREGRARLYFDAGPDGKTPESKATIAVAAKVTDGFIYPLKSNPTERASQVESLRKTSYLLIGEPERWIGLPTPQFNNMIEMANGHLRRIAAEVARQLDGGKTPPVTPTKPRGSAVPTPALD